MREKTHINNVGIYISMTNKLSEIVTNYNLIAIISSIDRMNP